MHVWIRYLMTVLKVGLPIVRTRVFWSLYWGPLVLESILGSPYFG